MSKEKSSDIFDVTAFTFTMKDGCSYHVETARGDIKVGVVGKGSKEAADGFAREVNELEDEFNKDPGLSHCDPMYAFIERLKERGATISDEKRHYYPEGTVF